MVSIIVYSMVHKFLDLQPFLFFFNPFWDWPICRGQEHGQHWGRHCVVILTGLSFQNRAGAGAKSWAPRNPVDAGGDDWIGGFSVVCCQKVWWLAQIIGGNALGHRQCTPWWFGSSHWFPKDHRWYPWYPSSCPFCYQFRSLPSFMTQNFRSLTASTVCWERWRSGEFLHWQPG